MFISTIVWRLIFVNQYYNSPTEFLGDKEGQLVQALLQIGPGSCLVTNRFKIGLFRELKRLHEAIFPLLIEVGNEESEARKHFFPRRAGDILLRVNEFSENLEGRYTNFEVTENNWILSHVLHADILSRSIRTWVWL